MYTLLYGLWKYLFQKDEYFVLILGLDNAGKTTFLEQTKTKFSKNYKGLNLSKITTTVGLNIGKVDMHGVRLNFWDLGGQEDLQVLWDKYYAECHAVVYIVDSSDIDRLQESKEAFDKMITNHALVGVPLLLVANKQDIPKCLTVQRIKEVFRESKHLIGRRDCHVLATSALHGDGVHEGIEWVVHCVKRNTLRPPKRNDDT